MFGVMTAVPPSAPRAETQVDLDALRHNVRLLAERAGRSGAEMMTVVKADGYGHGAVPVARAALQAGATWLGVASVDEALELRAAGITAKVLCWLHAPREEFSQAVAAEVDVSVSSLPDLLALVRAARAAGRPARAHLKVDTGLSRNGCPPQLWPDLVAEAARSEAEGALTVVAVWSHLACADELGHPSIDTQAARFADAYDVALAAGLRPLRHLANSAATLTRPDLHFDLVRAGIACYGLDPVPQDGDHGLRPVMTFRSSVVLLKRVAAGEGVSYGHTWTAQKPTTLALVPVGYGDGVPRLLSGKLEATIAGRRYRIAGRVCMDQIVLDCGDATIGDPLISENRAPSGDPGAGAGPEIRVGDEVLLFGPGDRGEQTAQDWADTIGTIHYEIVTSMVRPRLTHRFVGADPAPGGVAAQSGAGAVEVTGSSSRPGGGRVIGAAG